MQNQSMYRFSTNISIIVFLFVVGCSNSNQLSKFNENLCTTSLEGFVELNERYQLEYDLLFLDEIGPDAKPVIGEIIEITDDGVQFDEQKNNAFFDPKEQFIKNRDIHALMNKNGEILKGDETDFKFLTKEIIIHLISANEFNSNRTIVAQPNSPFSYCISPDEYQIEKIVLKKFNGDSDRTVIDTDFSDFKINVQRDYTNYLGHIRFENQLPAKEPDFSIPMTIQHRPKTLRAVMLFGITGGVLSNLMNPNKVYTDTIFVTFENKVSNFSPNNERSIHNLSDSFTEKN